MESSTLWTASAPEPAAQARRTEHPAHRELMTNKAPTPDRPETPADDQTQQRWPRLLPTTWSLSTLYFIVASLVESMLGLPGEGALFMETLLVMITRVGIVLFAVAATEFLLRRRSGSGDMRAVPLAALGGAALAMPWLVPAATQGADAVVPFWENLLGA